MKKLLVNFFCAFIPFRIKRTQIRDTMLFGVRKHLKAKRIESRLNFKHFLSVVAIVKNEGSYLKEWIEYHRLVGVEKFYIYDNESSDDTKEILDPYINAGIVEYIYYPGEKMQDKAYEDCIKKYKYDTRWLAIIDLDEFITPIKYKDVVDFLSRVPSGTAQALIGWVVYGSSGHKVKPWGGGYSLVIENFLYCGDKPCNMPKAIVNPRFVFSVWHHFCVVAGKVVDENCNEIYQNSFFKKKYY